MTLLRYLQKEEEGGTRAGISSRTVDIAKDTEVSSSSLMSLSR